jgi:hypothetical protein
MAASESGHHVYEEIMKSNALKPKRTDHFRELNFHSFRALLRHRIFCEAKNLPSMQWGVRT